MRSIRETILMALVIISIFILVGSLFYHPYSGPAVIEEPVQVNLEQTEKVVIQGEKGPVSLLLLASYQISAAVKSRRNYSSDYAAQISPLDLALAWGNLNQSAINKHIRFW